MHDARFAHSARCDRRSNEALPSSVSTRIRQAGAAMYSAEGDGVAAPVFMASTHGKGRSAYLIFVMLGVGSLFPFNAFITAVDYFQSFIPSFPLNLLSA
jgi:hypothetical protein